MLLSLSLSYFGQEKVNLPSSMYFGVRCDVLLCTVGVQCTLVYGAMYFGVWYDVLCVCMIVHDALQREKVSKESLTHCISVTLIINILNMLIKY